MNPHVRVEKPELVECLANTLGNAVHFYFKAQGHHWNVTGRDFSQFHDFFGKIYEDVYTMFDPIAENMRKLGSVAPHQPADLMNLSQLEDMDCGADALKMVQDLYASNNVVIASLETCFQTASDVNEQGVADYIAGRIDAHKMWRWQLSAYLSPTTADSLGDDVQPETIETIVEGNHRDEIPMAEQPMIDADGCSLCGYGECTCPGCDGGYCLCDEACPCPHCHVVMSGYEEFQIAQQQALTSTGILIEEEQDLAKALLDIVEKHGKFDDDDSGVWVGYTPAAENDIADIGVKCVNCVLYEGNGACKIIAVQVEEEGMCRFAVIPDGIVKPEDDFIVAAGSKPAPKKDRIKGSKKNAKGSAAGGKKIVFSDKVETALRNKVEAHNEKAKPGRKATLPMLKAVYRRGAGAFSSSHRPGKTRDQWAMARVNAFLKLLKSGSPANPNYKQDNDLLPKAHPKSRKGEAAVLQHEFLQVALKSADQYGSPEHAIFSMAEYSGLGYEVIPALRGAWLRGVRDGDVPFTRAYELATKLYNSADADLLPKKTRNA